MLSRLLPLLFLLVCPLGMAAMMLGPGLLRRPLRSQVASCGVTGDRRHGLSAQDAVSWAASRW